MGALPSGHSVLALPSSLIVILLILVGLFRRRVNKPLTMAGWPSSVTVCGLPRKSKPVEGPLRNMTGSVRRIWSGWLDLTMVRM